MQTFSLCGLLAGTGKRIPSARPSPLPPDTPRKAHNPLATAAAMQAVDAIRQQQQALAKKTVYAPHEASVATKVGSSQYVPLHISWVCRFHHIWSCQPDEGQWAALCPLLRAET